MEEYNIEKFENWYLDCKNRQIANTTTILRSFEKYKQVHSQIRKSFNTQFNIFKQEYKSKSTNELIKFPIIKSSFRTIEKLAAEYETNFATDFNIFDIIKIPNFKFLEDETHTPFIRHLLDVNGFHMQKDLFFKNFIMNILKINEYEYKNSGFYPQNPFYFSIREQKKIYDEILDENGFMDIVIDYYDLNNSFLIIIENKINHSDGNNQLLKYYRYLKKVDRKNKMLIYLTKEGTNPDNCSINTELFNFAFKEEKIIKLCSHYNDMTEILKTSLPFVKANNVKYTINQYIKTIQSI